MKETELKQQTKDFGLRIMKGKLLPKSKAESLHQEAHELTAIFVTSVRTSKGVT